MSSYYNFDASTLWDPTLDLGWMPPVAQNQDHDQDQDGDFAAALGGGEGPFGPALFDMPPLNGNGDDFSVAMDSEEGSFDPGLFGMAPPMGDLALNMPLPTGSFVPDFSAPPFTDGGLTNPSLLGPPPAGQGFDFAGLQPAYGGLAPDES